MLISGGKVIALDSINTNSATLSGNGVWTELGLNTSAVIDPLKQDISALSSTISGVSGKLDKEIADRISADTFLSGKINEHFDYFSGHVHYLSGELDAETDTRIEEDEKLSAAIDREVANRTSADSYLSATIDGHYNYLSGQIDFLSGELDTETDMRIEGDNILGSAIEAEVYNRIASDDFLSAAIDAKQDILSAGDNISIDENVVSVSGVKEINLHYPLFGVETKDGLVIGIHDTTRQFHESYTTTSIADPLSSQISIANGYKIKNNEFGADNNIKNFNLNVTYKLKFTETEDFEKIYSANFKVLDKDDNEVYVDTNTFDRMNSYSFGLNLKNNSPYKFKIEGDTTAFTGLDMNISCLGTWMPSYDYLDDLAEINETSANQILVWNPKVLGVSDDEILGIDEQTAIEV